MDFWGGPSPLRVARVPTETLLPAFLFFHLEVPAGDPVPGLRTGCLEVCSGAQGPRAGRERDATERELHNADFCARGRKAADPNSPSYFFQYKETQQQSLTLGTAASRAFYRVLPMLGQRGQHGPLCG